MHAQSVTPDVDISTMPAVDRFCVRSNDCFAGVFADAIAPFATVVRAAAAAHLEAQRTLGPATELAGSHDEATVTAYIETVQAAVLAPIASQLVGELGGGGGVADGIVAACARHDAELSESLAGLPARERDELLPAVRSLHSLAGVVSILESAFTTWTLTLIGTASAGEPVADAEPSTEPADETSAARDSITPVTAMLQSALERAVDETQALSTERLTAESLTASQRKSLERRWNMSSAASTDHDPLQLVAAWLAWYRAAGDRLVLCSLRITLHLTAAESRVALITVAHGGTIDPLLAASDSVSATLTSLGRRVEELFAELARTREGRHAARALIELLDEATATIEQNLLPRATLSHIGPPSDTELVAAETCLRRRIAELPESVAVHPCNSSGVEARPPPAHVAIALRSAAESAFDRWLVPARASFTEALAEHLRLAKKDVSAYPAMLRFHVGAAVEELRDVSWAHGSAEDLASAQAASHELARAGIERALEGVLELRARFVELSATQQPRLVTAQAAFIHAVESFVAAESGHQKYAQRTVRGLASVQAAARSLLRPLLRRASITAQIAGARTLRRVRKIIRYSRTAVVGNIETIDHQGTISALSRAHEKRERLPLVYRRLFSFHPLTDETLLAGREADIRWLSSQAERWQRGSSHALLLSGAPGCGLTTLINVARRTCLRGCRFHLLELADRVTDEAQLTARLIDALRLTEPPPIDSLTALADHLLQQDESERLTVCAIEHLEHLFIRTVGGADLMSRMLRFLSETDSRILWIATISEFAWQLVETTAPSACKLITHHRVGDYDRPALERVVMQRHERSGLPISFEQSNGSPLMRRRLRRAQSDSERQQILQDAFFDDLFNVSGQNIMLAVFYWLLAVDYVDARAIVVRPLPRLGFDFLELLPPTQAFALKSLLEHASLTVEEYARIANVDQDAGLEIFEALGNALTIESTEEEGTSHFATNFERIEPCVRYRIRPLMVQPIIKHLRSRNIVH